MIAPSRRIWLYPAGSHAIEIIMLGNPTAIAAMFVDVKATAERWPGFEHVQQLVQGNAVIGITAHLSSRANHTDVLAEALLMLRHLDGLNWSTDAAGMVAAW